MEQANDIASRSIAITKLLPATIDPVWKVWTNPDDIAQWWGPKGFTNTIHTMDVKPGGEWRLTMTGADGKRYLNKSMFIEIIPKEKIIFQHYNPHYVATIVFTPRGEETLLNWNMLFETVELFNTVVKVFKADEGLQQNVEKLEDYLKRRQ